MSDIDFLTFCVLAVMWMVEVNGKRLKRIEKILQELTENTEIEDGDGVGSNHG